MDDDELSYESVTEVLQRLPLFQGMASSDLTRVALLSGVRLSHYSSGRTLINAGAPCKGFLILASGSVCLTTLSDSGDYAVDEFIPQPFIMQPERLFGLTQRYTQRLRATTAVQVVSINKDTVIRLSGEDLVFRINMLNTISTRQQQLTARLTRPVAKDFTGKLYRFFTDRCTMPTGRKVFHITRQQLAAELDLSRDYLTRHLKAPEAAGLIRCYRSRIEIPKMESLPLPPPTGGGN